MTHKQQQIKSIIKTNNNLQSIQYQTSQNVYYRKDDVFCSWKTCKVIIHDGLLTVMKNYHHNDKNKKMEILKQLFLEQITIESIRLFGIRIGFKINRNLDFYNDSFKKQIENDIKNTKKSRKLSDNCSSYILTFQSSQDCNKIHQAIQNCIKLRQQDLSCERGCCPDIQTKQKIINNNNNCNNINDKQNNKQNLNENTQRSTKTTITYKHLNKKQIFKKIANQTASVKKYQQNQSSIIKLQSFSLQNQISLQNINSNINQLQNSSVQKQFKDVQCSDILQNIQAIKQEILEFQSEGLLLGFQQLVKSDIIQQDSTCLQQRKRESLQLENFNDLLVDQKKIKQIQNENENQNESTPINLISQDNQAQQQNQSIKEKQNQQLKSKDINIQYNLNKFKQINFSQILHSKGFQNIQKLRYQLLDSVIYILVSQHKWNQKVDQQKIIQKITVQKIDEGSNKNIENQVSSFSLSSWTGFFKKGLNKVFNSSSSYVNSNININKNKTISNFTIKLYQINQSKYSLQFYQKNQNNNQQLKQLIQINFPKPSQLKVYQQHIHGFKISQDQKIVIQQKIKIIFYKNNNKSQYQNLLYQKQNLQEQQQALNNIFSILISRDFKSKYNFNKKQRINKFFQFLFKQQKNIV